MLANNVDTDQPPHYVAPDLCLPSALFNYVLFTDFR